MEHNNYNDEEIKAFIDKTMDAATRRDFIAKMQNDEQLKREVAFQTRLKLAVENEKILALKTALQRIHAGNPIQPEKGAAEKIEAVLGEKQPSPKSLLRNYWFWGIAGALLICGAIGIKIIYFSSPNINYALLYQQNVSVYDMVVNLPNPNDAATIDTDPLMIKGLRAYQQKDYKQTQAHLSSYLSKNNDNTAAFYLALAYLFDDNTTRAIELLQKNSSDIFADERHWYLALAYIKSEKKDLALMELKKLTNSFSYATQAKELIEKLGGA